MPITTLCAIAALFGSMFLLKVKPRAYPVLALVASALQVATAFRVIRILVVILPLQLLFGGTLVVTGGLIYQRVGSKRQVTAATIVMFAGAIQVLQALRLI